jgi:hypothetical protein
VSAIGAITDKLACVVDFMSLAAAALAVTIEETAAISPVKVVLASRITPVRPAKSAATPAVSPIAAATALSAVWASFASGIPRCMNSPDARVASLAVTVSVRIAPRIAAILRVDVADRSASLRVRCGVSQHGDLL